MSDYINNYTTNVVFKVDEDNMTIHSVWEYDANKKEFSKVAGKLEFLPNNNTLINYGWLINKDIYNDNKEVSINDTNYLNGIILELDNNNNILFKGKMKGLIYRVYKKNLYQETTENYKTQNYKKIKTKKIKLELSKAKKYKNNFDIQINRMMLDMKMSKKDEIDVIFVNKKKLYL